MNTQLARACHLPVIRRAAVLAAIGLVLSAGLTACAQDATHDAAQGAAIQQEGQSGVEGAALFRRACAVERSDVLCPMSAVPDVTLIFERDGREIARVTTDSDGRYRLELPPGSYMVSTALGSPAFTVEPFEVWVYPGKTTRAYLPLRGGRVCGGECEQASLPPCEGWS